MYQLVPNRVFNSFFKDNSLPVLMYASEISGLPNWAHPVHKHDDMCELVLILEGKGHYIIDNDKYSAEKGDLLIYNKGIFHDEHSDPQHPLKTYVLGVGHFSINGLDDDHVIPNQICPILNTHQDFEKLKECFSYILDECRNAKTNYELICQYHLSLIIVFINRMIEFARKDIQSTTKDDLTLKIRDFIDKNYMHDIKLDDLSKHFCFSSSYLSHIFKKELNYSPIDYLINRRIGEAQRLLLATDFSINKIAQLVGYSNANYFGLVFKKITSLSISEFRNKFKALE